MNLINELRELAEDLYVGGYNRYASAMSKAADELAKWEAVFGHLGDTPDECGNAIIAARDELEECCAFAASALRVAEGWEEKCNALRAKIEAMEQQELVATVIKEGDSRYWMSERLWTFPDGKYPLYTLPGAQLAPGVPEKIKRVGSGFKGMFLREAQAYKQGWNECRAAMLAAGGWSAFGDVRLLLRRR